MQLSASDTGYILAYFYLYLILSDNYMGWFTVSIEYVNHILECEDYVLVTIIPAAVREANMLSKVSKYTVSYSEPWKTEIVTRSSS